METLILDWVQREDGEAAPLRVRLAVRSYPSDAKGFVSLTPECETMEGFERAVAELKENMASVLLRAREKFQQYRLHVKGEAAATDLHSVEEIWQTLEKCASIEEMRELFNALSLAKRQQVADFVLTQLNIFKGAASAFSQHYNEEEYLLD